MLKVDEMIPPDSGGASELALSAVGGVSLEHPAPEIRPWASSLPMASSSYPAPDDMAGLEIPQVGEPVPDPVAPQVGESPEEAADVHGPGSVPDGLEEEIFEGTDDPYAELRGLFAIGKLWNLKDAFSVLHTHGLPLGLSMHRPQKVGGRSTRMQILCKR